MKNEEMQSQRQWETPDMIILAMSEVTLGDGAAGTDYASEITS